MNIANKLSPLIRFKLAGSALGFISTIPGSIVFASAFNIMLSINNPSTETTSYAFGISIIIGLIFSFIPSVFGGWYLALWIYKNSATIGNNSGMMFGAIAGGAAMFGFDFSLGLLSLSTPHGPSLEMFTFYVITSTVIAIFSGMWVGLQLEKKIIKTRLHR